MTNQPPLSLTVKSRRLSFFGHLAKMDENAAKSFLPKCQKIKMVG